MALFSSREWLYNGDAGRILIYVSKRQDTLFKTAGGGWIRIYGFDMHSVVIKVKLDLAGSVGLRKMNRFIIKICHGIR